MVRLPQLYLQGVQMMILVMGYYFLLFDPSILVSHLFWSTCRLCTFL